MISRILSAAKTLLTTASISIGLIGLISCSPMTEARKDIPIGSVDDHRANRCAMSALKEMGFSPYCVPGASPQPTAITGCPPQTVFSFSPTIVMDVLVEPDRDNVRITAKGIGGLFPLSSKVLGKSTEDFQSRLNACLKEQNEG